MSKFEVSREGSDAGFNIALGKSGQGCSESKNHTRERALEVRDNGGMAMRSRQCKL